MRNKKSGLFGTMVGGIIFLLFLTTPVKPDNPGTNCQRVNVGGLTKIYRCVQPPKGVETTTLTLHLDRFSLPGNLSDSGNNYEVRTAVGFDVYSNQKSSVLLTRGHTDWGEKEYLQSGAWIGPNRFYKMGFDLVLERVPLHGKVVYNITLNEISGGAFPDRRMIISNNPRGSVTITAYPSSNIAYINMRDGIPKSSRYWITFGKAKRTVGENKIVDHDIISSLDLTLFQKKNIKVGGAVNRALVCDQYADMSVKQYKEARQHNCGFKGVEWSGVKQHHRTWCMHGNNFRLIDDAFASRKKQLDQCKKKPSVAVPLPQPPVNLVPNKHTEKICSAYALKAVKLNQKARKNHCGFLPPVWSNDHQKHFDWCMRGENNKRASIENSKRETALRQCLTQKSTIQQAIPYCQVYAQDAVNQYHTYTQRHCGPGGIGWSLDYNGHYNWCLKAYKEGNIAAIANETARRNAVLANCP